MAHEPGPHTLDAEAVRTWSSLALAALGRAREDIDAINVYPVADADTGTNLYLTAESADRALTEAFAEPPARVTDGTPATPSLPEAVRAYAYGALIGARGNSGTILAQLLRGVADVLGAEPDGRDGGPLLARALTRAAEEAYQAVAHPVEGTMLTVAGAAARAAATAGAAAATAADVARAAYEEPARPSPRPRASSPRWGGPESSTPGAAGWSPYSEPCGRRCPDRNPRPNRHAAGPCPARGTTGRAPRSWADPPTRWSTCWRPARRRSGSCARPSTRSATPWWWSAATCCGTSTSTSTTPARP